MAWHYFTHSTVSQKGNHTKIKIWKILMTVLLLLSPILSLSIKTYRTPSVIWLDIPSASINFSPPHAGHVPTTHHSQHRCSIFHKPGAWSIKRHFRMRYDRRCKEEELTSLSISTINTSTSTVRRVQEFRFRASNLHAVRA